ncbi:MAG: PD40 domain-containing protein [Anaerolinea sp.]|nr:PD40 domain-containing protein [Anaerolinea sp.]
MANQNIQAKLREGIEAARRGDKITARRLLQQVLLAEKNNEIALMWMASISDSLDDRRAFLERAVQVNPNNERAREALRRLGVEIKTVSGAAAPPPPREGLSAVLPTRARTGRQPNLYLIAAGIVGVVVVGVLIYTLINNLNASRDPGPATLQAVQSTNVARFEPTRTNTPDSRPPTATVFTGVIVTLDPNAQADLPPTWTPMPTQPPPPSNTPLPTAIPAGEYRIIASDYDPRLGRASLYYGTADDPFRTGQNEQAFEQVAYDPNSDRIAFVRPVYYEPEGDTPEVFAEELFVASRANPDEYTQVTESRAPRVNTPRWSPDGSRIVFTMALDGDEEVYLIAPDGGGMIQLTRNDAVDVEPSFRPDGMIVFASDADSPGFSEIWVIAPDGSGLTRLTNHPGSSYSPVVSPDGTRIAYINDQSGDGDVYVMDIDGQRPFLLTVDDNGAEDRTPVWSPNGGWIAFSSNREGDAFGWYTIDFQNNVTQIIAPAGRIPQTLNFLPDEGGR